MDAHPPDNLLDLPVSVFSHALATTPEGVTTLRRITSTTYYRQQIEAIRAEPDEGKQKELKKKLPAITPVARLHHRKADTSFAEKIATQWPLLYIDVDQADNPNVDMQVLKKHICRLPYVLLCADSVRHGFWCVIRLPNPQTPDTLAAHFRYVTQLFGERFGVKLDKSKGSNPCHLRYVSYDPALYLNDDASVMTGTYTLTPKLPERFRRATSGTDDNLLARVVRYAERAADGERHLCLLKAARLAGGFVAAGRMEESDAVAALETVASEWPTFAKSQKTIRDGIRNGKQKPLYADA